MKSIPLSKGGFALVSDEDYEYLSQFKWRLAVNGYIVRSAWNSGNPTVISMHREIMKPDAKNDIDHINMSRTDNRRENLREVSRSLNMANLRVRSGKKLSKYKGVSKLNRPNLKKPWLATIKVGYKQLHLGYFATQEEAALAYNKKALEVFGESAQLNVIEPE
jgi:hypothetical protein